MTFADTATVAKSDNDMIMVNGKNLQYNNSTSTVMSNTQHNLAIVF